MTTNVCHLVVRSLDVLSTLSADYQLQVHRKLVSFISEFEPEHDLFTQVPRSDPLRIKNFIDEGWEPTIEAFLNPENCPIYVAPALDKCPIENRTLSGWLRAAVANPQAESQIWMSQDWLSPTAEIWPPKPLSGAPPPAIRGDPHSSSLEEEPVHDSASASTVGARSDRPRMAQQEDEAPDEQDIFGARVLQQTLNGEFLQSRHADRDFAMETLLSPQSPSEQPNDEAVSTLVIPPARHPTVTVNFLYDGTRPWGTHKGRASKSFPYLSYRGVPTSISIGMLIGRLRPKVIDGMEMLGVTVIYRRRIETDSGIMAWCVEETINLRNPALRKTLVEWGWGSRVNPVWLAIWN